MKGIPLVVAMHLQLIAGEHLLCVFTHITIIYLALIIDMYK